jgi:outer membrane protein OmpA-like peptidoglycan-associated protein
MACFIFLNLPQEKTKHKTSADMRVFKVIVLLIGWFAYSPFILAQTADTITLANPSFEDIPRHSHAPRGWYDCGFSTESPPDIQPSGFSVTKAAKDGNTYLGMVVRDNDTWESISQQLSTPLVGGQCYEFSISLCRSELYLSPSQMTGREANYTTPARFRIFAGTDYCERKFLLGETKEIISTRWLEYNFVFEPDANYTHIVIEAFFKTPTLFPYNGNVLVDNASKIVPIPCDEPEEEIVAETPAPAPAPKQDTPAPAPPPVAVPAPVTKPAPPKAESKTSLAGLKRSQLRAGQTIRLDNLYFDADSSIIRKESYPLLNDIYAFMAENQDVVVEIGGHTNGVPPDEYCDRLSSSRAKAVAQYLTQKGINSARLQYKGYGKRKPIFSNETPYGREKNQRVEIKILSIDG